MRNNLADIRKICETAGIGILDFIPISRMFRAKSDQEDDNLARIRAPEIKWSFEPMAKASTIKIRLNSTAGTGYFYVAKKNSRTMTEKMTVRKYDPVARKHVEFKEGKIK